VDASFLHKRSLTLGDDVWQNRCKPIGKELREDLGHTMNEADGPIISHPCCIWLLGDEDDVRGVDKVCTTSH
jgi:hypothetical protein